MTAAATLPTAPAAPAEADVKETALAPVVTLVLWLGCLLVGTLGFVLPYARPRPPVPPAPVVQAELIKVELQSAPTVAPPIIRSPPPDPAQPPPLFAWQIT